MVKKIFTPNSVFWENREKLHNSLCTALKSLTQRKKDLGFQYETILKKRREAKASLISSVSEAKKLLFLIKDRKDTLEYIRKRWLCTGGTEDNFYLNVNACLLAQEISKLLEEKDEISSLLPKQKKAVLEEFDMEYEEVKRQIKVNKSAFKKLQHRLDENSKEEVVVNYSEDVPQSHVCDAYVETVQYQLQIRKRHYLQINDSTYIKKDNKWFLIDRNQKQIEVEEVKQNNLERIVNKYIR